MLLQELMDKRGLTDAKLAEKLKKHLPSCAVSTVYQWRIGTYQPRVEYLRPLCQILQCSADDLLGIESGGRKLPPAQARELLEAVTGNGRYNSRILHQMATNIRKGRGHKTEFEVWLRDMAETLYKIELIAKPNQPKSYPGEQLQFKFDEDK